MLRMIALMIEGHPDDPSGTRYGLYDAAAAVGYRRRAARALAMAPVFTQAYWRAHAGETTTSEVPTLGQVREEIARQGRSRKNAPNNNNTGARYAPDAIPGYVVKLAAKKSPPDLSTS
jgi:hypothetical protein